MTSQEGSNAPAERQISWALMAFPKKWRRHSGSDLVATALADSQPGARTVPPRVLADIVRAGLGERARGVPAAGRWLWGTYRRFLWLCAMGVLLMVVSELAYRSSDAARVAEALAILTAAYLVTRRARLRTAWMRADLIARSRGSGHRHKRAMKS